ncbi:MAG TPA: RNA methyltransferase [Cyclobacteriaceae bacterium]|nr:RNA methyltransferase [Cyclobacteriaceae bacterium]
MISKREIKLIRSLRSLKYRRETGLFLVEGEKSLVEVLSSPWKTELVVVTSSFLDKYPRFKNTAKSRIIETDPEILRSAGSLASNESGLAIVAMPKKKEFVEASGKLTIAGDGIRDPGNLGTLIRVADWYGIGEILLSKESADVYNSKVIQASMGSFIRVGVFYEDLEEIFKRKKIPLIGTFPEGESIYSCSLPDEGYILFGNESQGIGDTLARYVDQHIAIPRFGEAESLNVAVSAAVVLDNFMRRKVS